LGSALPSLRVVATSRDDEFSALMQKRFFAATARANQTPMEPGWAPSRVAGGLYELKQLQK
jgi:hypothetical protein